jgi:RNA polymerase sigma factor (TIGR02999 family)
MSNVTRILAAADACNLHAAAELLPLVYDELRKLAAAHLAAEAPGQTLQPTALVHEAYVRLVGSEQPQDWNGRGHFFAAAAEAMRRILVEAARRKHSQRRGGDRDRHEFVEGVAVELPVSDALIDLDAALTKLHAVDAKAAEVATLRLFAGMTVEEIAEVQEISTRTVKRAWAYARAWLGRELADYEVER